jgi:tetratricopeptide (TPR) repeat protein
MLYIVTPRWYFARVVTVPWFLLTLCAPGIDMSTIVQTMPEPPASTPEARGTTVVRHDGRALSRCPVPPRHRPCELLVDGRVLFASLIDESQGGFGLLLDRLNGLAVGKKARLHTKMGWFSVRVVYINRVARCDDAEEESDFCFRVGLECRPRNDGDKLLCDGQFDSAVAAYTEAIQFDPTDTRAYFGRACAHWHKNDFDRAIADYTEVIGRSPTHAAAYCGRAAAYLNRGDCDKAIADCTEAIHRDPQNVRARYTEGQAHGSKGHFDKAIAAFSEAIRLDPQCVEAYEGRGWAYGKKNEYDQAILEFTEAIRLAPHDAKLYSNRGVAYGKKADFARAILDFSEALRLAPNYAEAHQNLGWIYRTAGMESKAEKDIVQAKELGPKHEQ